MTSYWMVSYCWLSFTWLLPNVDYLLRTNSYSWLPVAGQSPTVDCFLLDYCLMLMISYRLSQRGAGDTKIKVPSVENTEVKSSPFKFRSRSVYIALHASLTARDFFLDNFFLFGSFTCIFFQNLSRVFPVLAVANTESCEGPKNKIGHTAGCRVPCWVPTEYE